MIQHQHKMSGSLTSKENVQSIYRLTRIQEAFAMLSLQWQEDPGKLVASATLRGSLEPSTFEEAWLSVNQSHEMLRSSVRQTASKGPILVVWKQISRNLDFLDLSDLDGPAQQLRINEITGDIQDGIFLNAAPTNRGCLITLSKDEHVLLWGLHHLMLDGWSTAIALRELLRTYGRLKGCGSSTQTSLFHFPEYLNTFQESQDSIAYWQQVLEGFGGMPRLNFSIDNQFQSVAVDLGESVSRQINEGLEAKDVTAGTLAGTAWSLILKKCFATSDVGFAKTVSGRSLPLDGLSDAVGNFSNVVPFRVHCDDTATIDQLTTEVQESQFASQLHEHVFLGEIEETCHVQAGKTICNSLLVVENFPIEHDEPSELPLRLSRFRSGMTSAFPLNVFVIPGKVWQVRLEFHAEAIELGDAEKVLDGFSRMLQAISSSGANDNVEDLIESNIAMCSPKLFKCRDSRKATPADDDRILLSHASSAELRLLAIWEDVLGVVPIGLGENFFELGGKSMTAVRILAKVEAEFGVRLSPAIFISHPTIKRLAEQLGNDGQSEQVALDQPIRFPGESSDKSSTVVCVHAGGGHATYFRFLARHLDSCKVIGLQPKGLSGGEPHVDFESAARFHIENLVSITESEPIHLVGYCMGSPLALEIASQLESMDRAVGSLTVVDSGIKWLPPGFRHFIKKSLLRGSLKYLRFRVRRFKKDRNEKRELNSLASSNKVEDRLEYYRRTVEKHSRRAFVGYEPKPIAAPILLIRSSEYVEMPNKDFHLEWEQVTKSRFSIAIVESDHDDVLMGPSAKEIAEAIREFAVI